MASAKLSVEPLDNVRTKQYQYKGVMNGSLTASVSDFPGAQAILSADANPTPAVAGDVAKLALVTSEISADGSSVKFLGWAFDAVAPGFAASTVDQNFAATVTCIVSPR